MTPRHLEVFRLLHLVHLPRLAAATGRDDLLVHLRSDDSGISATIETDEVLLMLRLADESDVSDDETTIAVVGARRLAHATLTALAKVRGDARSGAVIDVGDDHLRFLDGDTSLAQVPLLDEAPIDRRREIVDLLMQPRVSGIGDYPIAITSALCRIIGTLDLNLQSPVPPDADQLDDDILIERLRRAPAIHWSSYVAAVIWPQTAS